MQRSIGLPSAPGPITSNNTASIRSTNSARTTSPATSPATPTYLSKPSSPSARMAGWRVSWARPIPPPNTRIWPKLLPPEVYQKETAWYLKHLNPFGLPLDSRATYTKSDWVLWTATLTDKSADFQSIIEPSYNFIANGPERVPLSDWHQTTDG